MATFNGQRVNRTSGAGAGRGDNPHHDSRADWMRDQQNVARSADGFVGPRIGETYGSAHDRIDPSTGSGLAPAPGGRMQKSPSTSPVHQETGQAGAAGRMAHLDNSMGHANPRMFQHRGTGNIVESWENHTGNQRVNEFGTDAKGQSMRPAADANMSSNGYGSDIDTSSDDYTDVTDVLRNTDTYRRFNRRPAR